MNRTALYTTLYTVSRVALLPARRGALALAAALALVAGGAPALDAQDPTPLRAGQTLAGSVAPGDTVRYSLDTQDEWLVRGRVEQLGADVAVRLVRPDGRQAGRVDLRRSGLEPFQFETDSEGAYELQVIPVDDAAGQFRIVLERLEALSGDPEELAEQLLSRYDGPDSPGAGVRVWRDGRTIYTGTWGMANLAYGVPFREETPTNIGSTSKQFTAFSVMLLAERGLLSLDDDVRMHVPELPDFGQTIRVRHILNHTSGLRELYNLLIMEGRRFDQGDHVARDEIIRIVQNQPTLQNDPGAEWNYNNTAYGLSALIVERVSGQPFHEFVKENVFEPLGMRNSYVRPQHDAVVPGRSQGYVPNPDGGFREARDLGAAVGAGAIYASLEDLQTWIENYHEPRIGTRASIDEMMTPFVTTQGDTTGYGLGLMIDEQRGLKRVHHGGADVAHRSQLVYFPEIGAGITAQGNSSGFNSNVAFRLAEAFFADAMEPEEEEEAVAADAAFDPESYDPEDFDDYVGRYALDSNPQLTLTLSRDGDRLLGQVAGQPAIELTPTSDSTFTVQGVEASITLHRDDDGAVVAVSLHQGGVIQRASRVEGEDEAWEPTVAELREFTGRYLSEELETFYTIALEEDELLLQHRRRDDATLSPGERDEFSAAGLQISFERDRSGQIIAFYMSNVRTRDVRFQKIR